MKKNAYSRNTNKESFFQYYDVIILVGAWSNSIKTKGFYDRFDYALTEIITS